MILWIVSLLMILSGNENISNPHQSQKYKYLALGDSYTIGESVGFTERFPVQLVTKLKFQGVEIHNPEIIAKTGWTTDELMSAIESAPPADDFDLVTLLIGVNNQYRGRDTSNYKTEFEALLEKAIQFAGGQHSRVIAISIPDYGVTPFGVKKGKKRIAGEIDQFNQVNKVSSEAYGIRYVNITDISRKAWMHQEFTAEDGLHPSPKMYALWVDEILPSALEILNHDSQK